MCQASLKGGWFKQLNTSTLEEAVGAIYPQVSTERCKLAFRAGFSYPFTRTTLVGVPCMGDASSSHSISVWDKIGTPKLMHGLAPPFHSPQNYELATSKLKKGGVEVIMAHHIFWASCVWSVPLPPEHWCWLPHTPNPSTLNFSPLT